MEGLSEPVTEGADAPGEQPTKGRSERGIPLGSRRAAAGRLAASVPLTRSREARKGREYLKLILDREDLRRTLVRIAHEIVEANRGEQVALVGIHSRGAVMAGVCGR